MLFARNPKLNRMKVQCIRQATVFVSIHMHYHNISDWYNKDKMERGWGELVEEDEGWYSNWTERERKQNKRGERKWGAGGAMVAAVQPLISLMLPHQDLQLQACVCICACTCWHFSVSPVLAGRSCLCVALSHHLFLARLLISVLIISCSPLSV